MIVSQSPICLGLLSLIASVVADRMPSKLLKVTNNVGKALHAGRYSGSMIPLPPKIVLQANFASKEVHLPGRSYRRKRRPHRGPPPSKNHHEYPGESYNRGKYRGTHRPSGGKFRSPPPRSPYRDSDYYEQEVEDNGRDIDYDFEDSPYRDYSVQDVVHEAAEFHPSTYRSNRNKIVNHRDNDETFEAATVRKPRPPVKKLKNGPNQLRQDPGGQHSIFGGPSYRPYYHHQDEVQETEEDEFEEAPRPRKRAKLRKPKPREKPKYHNEDHYSSNFDNSDNYYHDRAFDPAPNENNRESGNEYHENLQETNKSKMSVRARPNYAVSGPEPTTKPLSWEEEYTDSHDQGSLRTQDDNNKWAPTVEPPQFPKLIQQPIRVIPVWHILPQYPGPNPQQQMNGDESKSVYSWVEPKLLSNSFKFSSQKKETPRESSGSNEVVANRLVADSIKWNPLGHQSLATIPNHFPSFNYSSNFWSSSGTAVNNDKQWSAPVTDGDIIYGSRASENPKHRIPDIGYGQGMELLNEHEDGASWQVY